MPSEGLTLTRQRIAEVMAEGKAATITEAGQLAGVHRVSVHRALHSASVQREISRLKAELTGKAKDLKALSSSKLARRVASDDASDALLLGTYKTANEVLASGVEDEAVATATDDDHAIARAKLMQAVKVGMYLERRARRASAHPASR